MRFFRRRQRQPDGHRPPVMEPCEPRILFSADLLPVGVAGSETDQLAAQLAGNNETGAPVQSAAVALNQSHSEERRHELVIVDTATPDRDRLVEQLLGELGEDRDLEVVVLDADVNGIAQITEMLSQYQGLDAIHLISHGSDGSVSIGNTQLNFDSLLRYGSQVQSWGTALDDDADFLIYGCDLAANVDGQGLVNSLAKLTGADVAASTDKTGASELGGDWDLEYNTGQIETAIALSESIRADFKSVLATFTVINTNDSGAGSLREAINLANLAAGADEITFNIPGAGVHTINVIAQLPDITDQVLINGWSEPDFAGTPVIELNGGNTGTLKTGLRFGFGSEGSKVQGLTINRFTGSGIQIYADDQTIQGNWIGVNNTGTAASQNAFNGVYVFDSDNIQIGGTTAAERNVISTNESGIYFVNATGSTISGNYIGTDVSGTQDLNGSGGASQVGVRISSGSGNTIGGTSAASRNVISGNNWFGVEITGGSNGNFVQGNYIGVDVTGQAALGNKQGGVALYDSTFGNLIGGGVAGAGNIISGNQGTGLYIAAGASSNKVQGNIIGLAADGVTSMGNAFEGVDIRSDGVASSVSGNIIGTDGDGNNDAAEGNVISANLNGVQLFDPEATGNTVAGNYIGTDASGTLDRGNSFNGIRIVDGANQNQIGGTLAAQRNVVSGNGSYGVEIAGFGSDLNVVQGNYIGTNALGAAAIGNDPGGMRIAVQASGNIIGGSATGVGNVISGNGGDGIYITDPGTDANAIQGNFIGTDATGTSALANADRGIQMEANAANTQIGGAAPGAGNVIAANGNDGILLSNGITGTVLEGNFIGTDLSATLALGNTNGIRVSFSSGNRIGGITASSGNTIANNSQAGVVIADNSSLNNSILRNSIDSNLGLGIDFYGTGVTANDAGDSDSGPNDLQNFPDLATANSAGGNLTLSGTLDSTASANFRLEYFSSPAGDAAGHGEGRVFLGTESISTDASGAATIATTLFGVTVSAGHIVTATATQDLGSGNFGGTSEFGPNVTATVSNVAPVIAFGEGDKAYTEGDPAIVIDSLVTLVDDSTDFDTGHLLVDFTLNGHVYDQIAIRDEGMGAAQVGVSGSSVFYGGVLIGTFTGSGAPLDVTFNASANQAAVEAVMRNITFHNTSNDPSTLDRTIRYRLSDGDGGDAVAITKLITVSGDSELIVTTSDQGADGDISSVDALLANRGADGEISLREAIEASNNTAGANQVRFNIAGAGIHTVTVTSTLPSITDEILIDATSQPGYVVGTPIIELNGGYLGSFRDALSLVAGSDGSTIRGLTINRFTGSGIYTADSDNHTIQGNWIGVDNTGTVASDNQANGIYAINGSGHLIGGTTAAERNVISSNANGVNFIDVSSATIIGNYIGPDASGTQDINGTVAGPQSGVVISGGFGNVIGGINPAARNVISGNNWAGVKLIDGTTSNFVQGNYIGTDVTGQIALGNSQSGINLRGSVSANIIGGGVPGAGNVISANQGTGVYIAEASAFNKVQGNIIGLAADGVTALGNASEGVHITGNGIPGAVTGNVIGSDGDGTNDADEGNIISSNFTGIRLTDSQVTGNTIAGNYIGTDVSGTLDRGNGDDGIRIALQASSNLIGGTTLNARNVIAGNNGDGVYIFGAGTAGNTVQGNFIGTDVSGTLALGNGGRGILVQDSASNTQIGGTAPAAANVISGNGTAGIILAGSSTGGVVEGNFIGTDLTATQSLGNGTHGVRISGSSTGNRIGGTAAGAGNTITNNTQAGVTVYDAATVDNSVLRNAIYSNGALGIDLGNDGLTGNDTGSLDADGGPNELQNFPELSAATTTGGNTTISGTLDSGASTDYRIEFFSSPVGDPSGNGEGAVYLGSTTVTTDSGGQASITAVLSGISVASGHQVSATATEDLGGGTFGSTSEFGPVVNANDVPPVVATTAGTLTYTENDTATVIDSGVSVSDADSTDLVGAVVSIAGGFVSGEDSLIFNNQAGISGFFNAATGTLTLTGVSSVANYQTALQSIAYQNSSDDPSTTTRTVWFTVNDGTADSNTDTRTISVLSVNDGPNNVVPGNQTAVEETTTSITGISITDDDDSGASLTSRLQVTSGVLDVTLIGSASVSSGSNGSADLTLLGTEADINATLASLTYTGNTDVTGVAADTLTVTTNDQGNTGSGGALQDIDTVQIDITGVNDAPVNSVPGTQTIAEETTTTIAGISTNDADDQGLAITTRLQVTSGVLNVSLVGGATISSGANGSADLTILGDEGDIDATLASLTYTGNTDVTGVAADTLTVTTNDQGNTGSGGALQDIDTVQIDITGVNDAPVNVVPGMQTVSEEVATGIGGISVSDADALGANLTTRLQVSNGVVNVTLSGLATISTGANDSADLTILGSGADINATLASLVYTGDTDVTGASADTLTVTTNDLGNTGSGGALQDVDPVVIDITPVNDAPVITAPVIQTVVEETATAVAGISIADVDDLGGIMSTRLVVTNGVMNVTLTGGATISTGANGSLDLTIEGTKAAINATLASLTYTGNTNVTGVAADSLTVIANDLANTGSPGAQIDIETVQIDITEVNDPPSITVPGPQTVAEETTTAITGFDVSDPDAPTTANITTRLQVSNGSLNVTLAGGATISSGANNSADLTLLGTDGAINSTLLSLTYTGDVDVTGTAADTLIVTANDLGNTGSGGPQQAVQTVQIDITAVNDAPVNTSPAIVSVAEETATAIAGISIVDADALGASLTTRLQVSGGVLNVTLAGSATISSGANNSADLTILGGQADINATLANLTYTGNAGVNGIAADTLTVTTNDQGNTGSGGALQDVDTVQIDIGAVNDAPVNTVPAAQTVTEETMTVIGGISIADADDLGADMATRLQVSNGVLAVTLAGSASVSAGANGSADLTILGTEADINTTLASLTYTGNADVTGNAADTLTVTTDDLGNTGSGGALQDVDTVQIDIAAVNDAPANTVPVSQTVAEETATFVTGISVSDVDHLGANLTTRLQVSSGLLTVTAAGGATISAGVNGSADLTLLGTVADINATLASLTYRGNTDVNGIAADTLTVTTNDQGNTGSGGALQDIDTVQIDITAVNDAPVNTVPGTQTVVEENPTVIGGINITDADDLGANLTTQLQVSNGVLSVTLAGGTTISSGANGAADLTLLGSVVDINATLASLTYTGNIDVIGMAADSLTVTTNDLGNTGSGGALQDQSNIQIDINPVNDSAPVITSDGGGATASVTSPENGTAVTTVTATDADLPAQTLTYGISGGADAARFVIDPVTGSLSFQQAPDFESPNDLNADGVYEIVVSASDGSQSTTQTMLVNLADVNEAPTNIVPGQVTVSETQPAGTQVASLTGVDQDSGEVLTYTLVNDNSGLFQLNSNSGELGLLANANLDFANQNQHQLLVRVTDSAGLTFDQLVVINVTEAGGSVPTAVVPPPPQEPAPVEETADPETNLPAPEESPPEEESEAAAAEPALDVVVPGSSPVFDFAQLDIPQFVPDPVVEPFVPVLTTARNVSTEYSSELELSFEWVLLPNNAQDFDNDFEPLASRRVTVSFENPDRGANNEQTDSFLDLALDPVRLASSLLSVGAVWWLTRSGGLITTMLMGIPTWRHLDLLPVVAKSMGNEAGANDGVGDVFDLDPEELFSDTVVEAMFEGRRSAVEAEQ